jgi:hypothetical protein
MYPDDTTPMPTGWRPPPDDKPRTGLRVAAIAVAALLLVAAGTGIGLAIHTGGDADTMAAPQLKSSGQRTAHKADNESLSREDWARQYGQDRSSMPNLPDVASATAQQQAAAADLLARTQAATAAYADINAAKAAGFDVDASLARTEQFLPRYAQWLQAVDAGQMPRKMPMLHVANRANLHDSKVLDPAAPEVLMYEYQGNNAWKLVGVMYLANDSYPHAPPDPGGPITRWHYHTELGGQLMKLGLMMHVFFVPGNDLAHAYALTMDGM